MDITVTMTAEEFEEFRAYQKDKNIHQKAKENLEFRVDILIRKISNAIEPDPKKPNTYKIVDQEQMDDLWIIAGKDDG